MKKKIELYDTTLRDGTQAEDISFSVEDKIRITQKLDELGIHFVEGGWPGSNPKDLLFFQEIGKESLRNTSLVAFGMTRRANTSPHKDSSVQALLKSKVKAFAIVGKSWDLHVKDALRISLQQNLDIVYDTLSYLRKRSEHLFFDAEHFFNGYSANPDYTLDVLKAAEAAEVDCIVLCDTNGGTLPMEVYRVVSEVGKNISTPLGIHAHNDAHLGVANTLMAVEAGAEHVQGTINGFGERCGNADLCAIIPNLQLKLGYRCISKKQLATIRELSRFVYELANVIPNKHQPYVGNSAFAHKGGMHVDAVAKNPETYEHIKPELVGNHQRVLVSDLSGKSNILYKAEEYGLNLRSNSLKVKEILNNIKELEHQGFQFEGAEASFKLLINQALDKKEKFFTLVGFRVIDEKRKENETPHSEATIMVKVGGKIEHTAAEGAGPVNALDNALRKALERFFPKLREVKLIDYKVRVLPAGKGTASKVRVLIESGDSREKWGTVGVSDNIIEASWQALVDSIDFKLYKDKLSPHISKRKKKG